MSSLLAKIVFYTLTRIFILFLAVEFPLIVARKVRLYICRLRFCGKTILKRRQDDGDYDKISTIETSQTQHITLVIYRTYLQYPYFFFLEKRITAFERNTPNTDDVEKSTRSPFRKGICVFISINRLPTVRTTSLYNIRHMMCARIKFENLAFYKSNNVKSSPRTVYS